MSRFCQIQDHNLQTSHVCTFEKCEIKSRWNCAECFRSQIHKHDKEDYSHILPLKQMLGRSEQVLQNIGNIPQNNNELQKAIVTIENLEKQLRDFKLSLKKLQGCENMITTYKHVLQRFMRESDNTSEQLDNYDIRVISNPQEQYERIISKYNNRLDKVHKMGKKSMIEQMKNLQQQIMQIQNLQSTHQLVISEQKNTIWNNFNIPFNDNPNNILIIKENQSERYENLKLFYEQKVWEKVNQQQEQNNSDYLKKKKIKINHLQQAHSKILMDKTMLIINGEYDKFIFMFRNLIIIYLFSTQIFLKIFSVFI